MLLLFASTSEIVKLEVPAVVGTPEITPVELTRLNPAGKVPELTDQVSGAVQPLEAMV